MWAIIIQCNQWGPSSTSKWEEERHLTRDRISDTAIRVAALTSSQLLCQKINPWLQQNLDAFSRPQRGPLIIHNCSPFSKLINSELKYPTKCSLPNPPWFSYRSFSKVKVSQNKYFFYESEIFYENLRKALVNNSECWDHFAAWDFVLCLVCRIKSAHTLIT